MDSVIFNIPAPLVEAFPGQKLIVRADHASEFVQNILPSDIANVVYVQLLDIEAATSELITWGEGVPVDLVVADPANEFTLLYDFSALQHKHPVRASISVKPGFAKAVKAALALKFAVKLDVSQPDSSLLEELALVKELFLHRSTVDQPVEFFYSTFLSFYHHEPGSMWQIQEEDPDMFCYVTDDGEEIRSRRVASAIKKADFGQDFLQVEKIVDECANCAFFDPCRGYFKLPRADYDCTGMKILFTSLKSAAEELESDLAAHAVSIGGKRL